MAVPAAGPLQTAGKHRFFASLDSFEVRLCISPNYTPYDPELRLIATQVSDQIGGVKSRVALRRPGLCMSIRSVKFVPALFAGAVVGANLATMTDLAGAGADESAEAAIQAPQTAADGCLSAPKGATPCGQPLVLSHRSRHQASMLVSARGKRQGRRQVHARHVAAFGSRASFGSHAIGSGSG